MERWKQHVEKVFNMDEPESEANITSAERALEINIGPPDEAKKAIATLNNREAASVG